MSLIFVLFHFLAFNTLHTVDHLYINISVFNDNIMYSTVNLSEIIITKTTYAVLVVPLYYSYTTLCCNVFCTAICPYIVKVYALANCSANKKYIYYIDL